VKAESGRRGEGWIDESKDEGETAEWAWRARLSFIIHPSTFWFRLPHFRLLRDCAFVPSTF
jgi:hypothetical protein